MIYINNTDWLFVILESVTVLYTICMFPIDVKTETIFAACTIEESRVMTAN